MVVFASSGDAQEGDSPKEAKILTRIRPLSKLSKDELSALLVLTKRGLEEGKFEPLPTKSGMALNLEREFIAANNIPGKTTSETGELIASILIVVHELSEHGKTNTTSFSSRIGVSESNEDLFQNVYVFFKDEGLLSHLAFVFHVISPTLKLSSLQSNVETMLLHEPMNITHPLVTIGFKTWTDEESELVVMQLDKIQLNLLIKKLVGVQEELTSLEGKQ